MYANRRVTFHNTVVSREILNIPAACKISAVYWKTASIWDEEESQNELSYRNSGNDYKGKDAAKKNRPLSSTSALLFDEADEQSLNKNFKCVIVSFQICGHLLPNYQSRNSFKTQEIAFTNKCPIIPDRVTQVQPQKVTQLGREKERNTETHQHKKFRKSFSIEIILPWISGNETTGTTDDLLWGTFSI